MVKNASLVRNVDRGACAAVCGGYRRLLVKGVGGKKLSVECIGYELQGKC